MKFQPIRIISILSSLVVVCFIAQSTSVLEPKFQSFVNPRRILHQPLFPENTAPPTPPPPPPPTTPILPFFPEIPSGASPNQAQEQPPPPPGNETADVSSSSPVASATTQKEKSKLGSSKRFAIAISVGIVTSGILLLGLGFFYLYKYKMKDLDESQKPNRRNLIPQDSILPPPSTFLHIGTLEPAAAQRLNLEGSSDKRLNSVKFSDYYRPSPELQPLPPLSKPPLPPPRTNSSPHMSSSDEEESHESTFYTPNGSSLSNEEGSNSNTPLRNNTSVPHSKRTSPKSRVQIGKPAIPFAPIRPKFSAPPPPPDFARLQLITKQVHEMSKAPIPPPPPPPPPPPQLSAPRVVSTLAKENSTRTIPKVRNPVFSSPTLQEACKVEEMVNSSLERNYGDEVDESRPKLKPLHWDKVRATSDRATVWDKLKSSSFQLDEDVMESLFGCESSISVPKEVKRKSVLPQLEPQTSVLDPKKSHNIAILLRALNVTRDEVSKALLDGNLEGLGPELLETLVKMAPTKEEEIKLRDYNGDTSRLGSAERFLKAILDIPLAFKRVDAMLYRANFDTEVNYLIASFLMLEEASKELKNSKLFFKLLEAVLRTGNRMNVGTNRGDARSFKLDTLLKLADVKGTDGKTTLLHFVVQEIIRSEEAGPESTSQDHTHISSSGAKDENFRKQGLHVLAGLSRELVNVKKAATMDSSVLNSYVSKLELGLEKVRLVLQYEKPSMEGKFFESMKKFIKEAQNSIAMIKSQEQKALSSVKEVTQFFHGDATKEEAHPFRIFVIVRDFLSTLDNVCKDVRKIQDRSMVVGTSTSFRAPVPASLPILRHYNVRKEGSSSDSFSP